MVLDQARDDIVAILKKAGVKAAPADLVFPPDSKMGDLSLPLFAAAKERGVAPGKLTQEIAHTIKPHGLVERVEAAGPYINFWLKREGVVKAVITPSSSPPYLKGEKKLGRIMLEMVSPNNNKPLHLGHLRNAFLGESVSRLLESQGAKIIRACLFNDRGLHIAKAMLAYKLWGKGKTPKSAGLKGDQFVVQWYVEFERQQKLFEKDGRSVLIVNQPERNVKKELKSLLQEAEELVQKFEESDPETIALWKKMAGWANDGIMFSLKRLGLKFDAIYYESKLWKKGKQEVEKGLKKGIFKKDKTGAIVAIFGDPISETSEIGSPGIQKLPPKVLLRSDGTAIYATADLALTPEKFKKYKLNRSIWCVGQEQDLYLQQLFAIFRMLGFKWVDACEHLSYGLVHLPEGRMKTREGTVVEADPLLDHIVGLVKEEIKARHTHLTEREIEDRAEIIAQAAVRYYLLKVAPRSAVHFDPKASIAFTGDTGPYLLYTYARIASILRKASSVQRLASRRSTLDASPSISDLEWHLIILLGRFPEVVEDAATDRDPSHLSKYLFDLAQQFSAFYEKKPVLKAEEPARSFRLTLLQSIRATLKQGLHLLTIETAEEM